MIDDKMINDEKVRNLLCQILINNTLYPNDFFALIASLKKAETFHFFVASIYSQTYIFDLLRKESKI